jgi:hypothetical protein
MEPALSSLAAALTASSPILQPRRRQDDQGPITKVKSSARV